MKTKEFFKRWGQGIRDLSPKRQLESKLIGAYGTILGVIIGWLSLGYTGSWGFSVLFLFIVFMQVIDVIGLRQQIKRIKEVEKLYMGGNYEDIGRDIKTE